MSTARLDLAHARLVVSGDALLSVSQAATLIGGRGAREWIEAHVRIRWAAGQRRVLWRDVIEATADHEVEAPSRRKGGTLRLADL